MQSRCAPAALRGQATQSKAFGATESFSARPSCYPFTGGAEVRSAIPFLLVYPSISSGRSRPARSSIADTQTRIIHPGWAGAGQQSLRGPLQENHASLSSATMVI